MRVPCGALGGGMLPAASQWRRATGAETLNVPDLRVGSHAHAAEGPSHACRRLDSSHAGLHPLRTQPRVSNKAGRELSA